MLRVSIYTVLFLNFFSMCFSGIMGGYIPPIEIKGVKGKTMGETSNLLVTCKLIRTKDDPKILVCELSLDGDLSSAKINLTINKGKGILVSALLHSIQKNGKGNVRFTIGEEALMSSYVDIWASENSFRLKLSSVSVNPN